MTLAAVAPLQWAEEQTSFLRNLVAERRGYEADVAELTARLATRHREVLAGLQGNRGHAFVDSLEFEWEYLFRQAISAKENLIAVRVLSGELSSVPRDSARELTTKIDALTAAVEVTNLGIGKVIAEKWFITCRMLDLYREFRDEMRADLPTLPPGPGSELPGQIIREFDRIADRLANLIRYVSVSHPEWGLAVPDHLSAAVWTIHIPLQNYLRSMANLFWSAIRHPLSDTTIDLSTGRVLYRT